LANPIEAEIADSRIIANHPWPVSLVDGTIAAG